MRRRTHDRPVHDLTPAMEAHVPRSIVERYTGGRAVMVRGACRVEKSGEETVYFYKGVLIQRRNRCLYAMGEKFSELAEVRKRVDLLREIAGH